MTEQVAKVRGADRLARTMHAAADDLETMDRGLEAYGRVLARAAQDRAPVRTGRLRDSIALRGRAVSATVRYAAAQEARRHYMARAVTATAADADQVFTRAAADITDKIKGA